MILKTLPVLVVFFMISFLGVTDVTNTFFYKEHLALSAADLVSLGIWVSLPWSTKIIFGTIVDGVKLFGSRRKSYLVLGSVLMTLGGLLVAHLSHNIATVSISSQYTQLLIAGLLSTVGIVLCNIVANTLAIEIATTTEDISKVQVWTRIASGAGGLLAAALTGLLASKYSATSVYLWSSFLPILGLLAAVMTREEVSTPPVLNKKLLIGGISFGAYAVLCGMYLGPYAQVAVFCMSLLVINTMLWSVVKDMESTKIKTFILTCVAIFLFRCTPGPGPGESWWMIESLKFDPAFMGVLRISGQIASFIILGAMAGVITKISTRTLMITLTGLSVLLFLPQVAVFYHLHELIGLTARNVMLVDNAVLVPIGALSMIPLGVLVAQNAPKDKRAIYISLISSFMNISLVGGDLISKQLNQWFVVTRTDFSQLGRLMLSALIISTGLSILGILFLRK